ncbi:restriction endonuclease subunit S [Phaeobacter inhibens]|uniref:restriction endonuclease subunit S n=1 Tax=Phaeobacter inhibens TaxID=221822 RepID=UPI00248FE569|nr:restriction endonuclease subunit S [Phaeobacter inhibens]
MHLGELCTIHSGYTARGRLVALPDDGMLTIQLRDVGLGETLNSDTLERYDLPNLADRYLVQGGEVIFKSRGEPNTAAVVEKVLGDKVAVLLPLLILRPDTTLLSSGYLAWAINQQDAQRKLGAEAQGTSLRMISKATLENLEIPVPDLETQHRIATLDALSKKEGRLLRDLANSREQLHSKILSERAELASSQGNQR